MRAFFAIEVAPEIQYAIEKWRDRAMPPAGRAVPAANFHITLGFLGRIDTRQLDRLCVEVDQINAAGFRLCLDKPGYFPGAGIFWIGATDIPAALPELAARLRKAGRKADRKARGKMAGKMEIARARRPFEPHITLFRNCRTRPPLPALAPGFDLACDGFALFESIANHKGVRYEIVHRWECAAAGAHRPPDSDPGLGFV